VITTGLAFGVVLLGLNVSQYIYRSVPGRPPREGLRVVGSVMVFEVLLASLLLITLGVSGGLATALRILHVGEYSSAFVLAGCWVLAEICCQDLLAFLYARQRIGQANILDLIKQAGWIPVILIWWAIRGSISVDVIVGASFGGAVCAAAVGLAAIRPAMRPSWPIISKALRFALPLVIPGVAFLALKVFDRLVLSATRGLDETGIYSLAASFTNLLYGFSAVVIANTLTPMAVRLHNEGDPSRRDRLLWRTMGFSLSAYIVGAVGLFAVGVVAIPRLARPEYLAALPFLPWLVVGYALVIVSAAPHNALYLADRTRTILVIDLVATGIAIWLDLVLIPRFGGYGAAIATIVGFGGGAVAKLVASGLWRSFRLDSVLPTPAEVAGSIRALRH
jgi:O-antigen/teichoic acid export membrane protein